MDSVEAWGIVSETGVNFGDFTEDEIIIYEEALYCILIEARKLCEIDDCCLWNADAEAGAFNLAFYYEMIGKYGLAIKYYKISKSFGCDFADEMIERIEELL